MDINENGQTTFPLEQWSKLLKNVEPKEDRKTRKCSAHDYIILKEGQYTVASASDSATAKKLSISDIVRISREKISEKKESVNQAWQSVGYLTNREKLKVTLLMSDTARYTSSLINAKEKKRELSRTIALVLCVIASFPLPFVGIPLLIMLRKDDKKFEQEIADLKQNIYAMNKERNEIIVKKRQQDVELLEKRGYSQDIISQLLLIEDDIPQLLDRIYKLEAEQKQMKDLFVQNEKLDKQIEGLFRLFDELNKLEEEKNYQSHSNIAKEAIEEQKKILINQFKEIKTQKDDLKAQMEVKNLFAQRNVKLGEQIEGLFSLFGEINKLEEELGKIKNELEEERNDHALTNIKKAIEEQKKFLINQFKEIKTQKDSPLSDQLLSQLLSDQVKKIEEQMGEANHELKNYVADIQDTEKNLGLSFERAAKYVHLKADFFEHMSNVFNPSDDANKKVYPALITSIIEGTFNDHLDAYDKLGANKSVIIEQFAKDIPRGAKFKRIDLTNNINDTEALPASHSSKKISDAAYAIAGLIVPKKDEDWILPLQLAVTQTNLNGAFFQPKALLADLGSQVTWQVDQKDYAIVPKFSREGGHEGKLPPVTLEIVRNPDGAIEKVNVTVEGGLDLVKRKVGDNTALNNSVSLKDEDDKMIVKEAMRVKLKYTLELNENNRPVVKDMKCSAETKMPAIGSSQEH
jgi:hypothetical protein